MNRWIEAIVRWWRVEHPVEQPPCAKIPGWREADRREAVATARRCMRDVRRARDDKRAAVNANLRGVA